MHGSARVVSLVFLYLVSTVCSASTTSAERWASNRDAVVRKANEEVASCSSSLRERNREDFTLVYSKIMINASDPDRLAKMMSKELADQSFVRAALKIWSEADRCTEAFLNQLASVNVDVVRVHRMFLDSRDRSRILLLEGKISFGEYNMKGGELLSLRNQQLAEIGDREQRGLIQMHESEIGQRVAAWNALSESMARSAERNAQALQQMQSSAFRNQPTYTTCNKVGGSINCVTR